MTRGRFLLLAIVILLAGGALRVLWLRADPPTTSVGIVWHDEGAWVHNARNKALWGAWRTDNWNPVFIAPVFTAAEYAAFEIFGVGTWQARTVPAASGMLALLALIVGLRAVGGPDQTRGRRAALIGGVLLAFNFTWVMWNRAALMESTMTAFIVVAWAAYALGSRQPRWGFVAGLATVLAWFTKASAAFFLAALVADVVWTIALDKSTALRSRIRADKPSAADARAAWFTLTGIAGATVLLVGVFVLPNWSEYQFYNWQMTVVRKPSYDLESLIDRASWLPIVHDFFTRSWMVLVGAALGAMAIASRWRVSQPAERLLVLWLVVGLLELTIHESGTERRYVMFLPALAAMAALLVSSSASWLPADGARMRPSMRVLFLLVVALLVYLVTGSAMRQLFADDVAAGVFRSTVRVSAFVALALAAAIALAWHRFIGFGARLRIPFTVATTAVLITVAWDVAQYVNWARQRGELNYQASAAIGALLQPGTLVHGKLANGLSLENRIRPIFVGEGFGNFDDRLFRDDARYILTIGLPEFGRDSPPGLIQEILDRYPSRRVIATFVVEETPEFDQAWLFDKFPGAGPASAVSGSSRAPD